MAISINQTSQLPGNSPGIYFKETDLSVITKKTGTFSAAAITLTEKGPAFAVSNSGSYTDRISRLGDQNPDFPSSYYAKQYLEQASNYKEVRMLGLEGYKDTVGYGITYSTGSTATDISTATPLVIGPQQLACVLKARPTTVTTGNEVVSVIIQTTPSHPGGAAATDYLFQLQISYNTGSPDIVIVSLRPESKDYIVKKFGTDPLKTPYMGSKIAPLWVDFIIPSIESLPTIDGTKGYYVPGTTTLPVTYLNLTTGETAFGISFTFNQGTANPLDLITPGNIYVDHTGGVTNYVQIKMDGTTGDVITSGWLVNGILVDIEGIIIGTGNITATRGVFEVADVALSGGCSTFKLADPITHALITSIISTSTLSISSLPTITKYNVATWENQVLDYSGTAFTTPVTPWFVSDGDSNGHIKNLFRFWSISDGATANTYIKIEISNIDTTTNNGIGSFDITVRRWNDSEDSRIVKLETFSRLTMDSTSPNYILRRIGNGDDFQLRSSYIFVEMNTTIQIQPDDLPWGCLGYPNVSYSGSIKIQDIPWTLDYNKNKPTSKQTLGLANNNINMNKAMVEGFLSLKTGNTIIGKGFHLNPNQNANLISLQSSVLKFAPNTIYLNSQGNTVTVAEKINRNKFVVDFAGGFDGWNVYSTRKWNDPASADYQSLQLAINLLADKEEVNSDFTILTTPELNFQDHPAACDSILTMIQNRGDCVYLPDFAYDPNADSQAAVDALLNSNMLSNDISVYFPYLQMKDTLNTVNNWLPPSLLALGTIAYVSTNEYVWQPPGGSVRTVTNNLVRTRRRLNAGDREILFTANINPITSYPGSGYEISGVRTTQIDFSALSFIHNRLLLCYAKKALTQVLRPLLFTLNGAIAQDQFLAVVNPIFARIKKLNGIADFKVNIVNNDQTAADLTTIYGQIVIQPLLALERIICDFNIVDNAVTFAG